MTTPCPSQRRQVAGRVPRLRTATGTLRTEFLARNRERLADASGGLRQVNFEAVLQVAARLRSAPLAAAEQVAEQVAENVKNVPGLVEMRRAVESFETGMAVAVVAGRLSESRRTS